MESEGSSDMDRQRFTMSEEVSISGKHGKRTVQLMKRRKSTAAAEVIPINRRSLTDSEIVEGILAGDPTAGDALVERFGRLIERRVWRLTGGDGELADLVQQVYQQLVGSLHKLADRQALAAWVETVTVNVVLKEFRRRKYRRNISYCTVDAEQSVDFRYNDRNSEQRLLLQRAFSVLNEMPSKQRIIFSLRFIEGMSLANVATHTGYSLATVKRQIRKSRDVFMQRAGEDPYLATLINEEDAG